MEESNQDIGRQLQTKFEFYLIALVFTILGLSIQTGSLSCHWHQLYFELSAWSLFLVSGFFGLWRLEWIPVSYNHAHLKIEEETRISGLREGIQGLRQVINRDTGELFDHEEVERRLNKINQNLDKRIEVMEKLEKCSSLKYSIHRYSFALGMLSLVISRTLIQLARL